MGNPSTTTDPGLTQQEVSAVSHLWRSPWTGWVGMRYLRSKKNSRFLSFITLLSIMGVGLGVTAMIVVLSVMDGFEEQLKKRLMSSDLHILVTPSPQAADFDQGRVFADALQKLGVEEPLRNDPRVERVWPVISTEAILKAGKKVSGVVFKGVGEERMARLKQQLAEGTEVSPSQLPGVYIGQELAYELRLIPGDPITLISPTETEGPLESVPRLKKLRVEGIYHSGTPEQELHTVFAKDSVVRSFLRRQNVVSQWEIGVKRFDDAPAVAAELRAKATGFHVQDWMQMNSHLFASLKLERVAMFVILAFIVVVASFNIVTTLTLMVLEKKREIAILKAMGARHGQVAAIFLAEGILIGGLGVVGGVISGGALCLFLRSYPIITLPAFYYDRTLPVNFDVRYVLGVAVCALLIVLTACLYPSRRASRINPLDGIRFG